MSAGAGGTDFPHVTLNELSLVPGPSGYATLVGAAVLLCAVRRRSGNGRVA